MISQSRLRRTFAGAVAAALLVGLGDLPARAGQEQLTVVADVPATTTPDVNDGTVGTIAEVGTRMYLGGDFTNATPRGGSVALTRNNILAFDRATGALDPAFVPTLDGAVEQIIPGPGNTVYVAGSFKTVNGAPMRLARLDASTGAVVTGWKPPVFSAATNTVALAGSTLYVGGGFTKVAGVARGGLVAVDPLTGAVQPWLSLSVSGQHGTGLAVGAVGPKKIDVTPDGRSMAVIGNFTSVADPGGVVDRDQVFLVNLVPGTSAAVNRTWRTLAYTDQCANRAFASYVRDVQYSPDGGYFVIAATGGAGGVNIDGTKSSCDAAARFETNGTGTNVRPTWIAYTGGDSLWSVAVTGTAVYVGGHQRWMNNRNGRDQAQAGAVPRPGVAALEPGNGLPLTWNPGRNPRGAGAFALLATSSGLYVGSDTEWIGNFQYRRRRIAAFMLSGGHSTPPAKTGLLPGTVYSAGPLLNGLPVLPATLVGRSLATSGAVGAARSVDSSTLDWSSVRGAFLVDDTLYYGLADGTFHKRSFDGTTLGPDTVIDPYNDPFWSDKGTGKGTQTYRGVRPALYGQLATLTSAFYSGGFLYYTQTGRTGMYYRAFSAESGVIDPTELTVADGLNWSGVAGAFASGGSLYYVNRSDGVLRRYGWSGVRATGTSAVVDAGNNWAARSLFLRTAVNQPPKVVLTANCPAGTSACTIDAGGSTDDGTITSYRWDFADGQSESGTASSVSHTYTEPGVRTVTVTATDDAGATGTGSVSVEPTVAQQEIGFRAATSIMAEQTSVTTLTVPPSVQEGDTLLLFQSVNSTTTGSTTPSGWERLSSRTNGTVLTSTVYRKVASASDAGTEVTVPLSAPAKVVAAMAAYSGVSSAGPIGGLESAIDSDSATHSSPAVLVPRSGSWVVTYWADKSTTPPTTWTTPADLTRRAADVGSGTGSLSGQLADTGGAVAAGLFAPQDSAVDTTSGRGISWALTLNPAPASALR
jgi:PKD repeat protein